MMLTPILAMSDANIDHLIQAALAVALAYIGYMQAQTKGLQIKSNALQEQNHDMLNSHLAAFRAEREKAGDVQSQLSYAQGQAAGPDVAQSSLLPRPGPLDGRLGPDPLHAQEPLHSGPTDRPA
jgi:hypothetical protein